MTDQTCGTVSGYNSRQEPFQSEDDELAFIAKETERIQDLIHDHHRERTRLLARQEPLQPEDDELTFITKETERIQNIIHDHHRERARLLARHNAIRSSTRALPHEILSKIFQLAFPPMQLGKFSSRFTTTKGKEPKPHLPIILGAVSSHWRAVAWTTPKLWETISLDVLKEDAQSIVLPLETYIRNADYLPSEIELDFRPCVDDPLQWLGICDKAMKLVGDALFSEDNSKKIGTLLLHLPPPSWWPLILQKCSTLRELSLTWPLWPGRLDFSYFATMTDFPKALGLHLSDPRNKIQSHCTTLTTLHLNDVPIDICFDLLIHCPNLIFYVCLSPWPPAASRSRPQKGIVTMAYLQHLEWELGVNVWSYSLLRFVRFPALRHLGWLEGGGDNRFLPHFDEFISGLQKSLQVFKLYYSIHHSSVPLFRVLSDRIPQLSQLILSGPNARIMADTLRDPSLLPALRILTFQTGGNATAYMDFDITKIFELRGITPLRIEFEGMFLWHQRAMLKLQQLTRRVADLDVVMNSIKLE